MALVIIYLVALLGGISWMLYALIVMAAAPVPPGIQVCLTCAAVGGLGGCIYCLRGVYLNACVEKRWDPDWHAWYFIRPILSIACGGVSYLFLRAGLLVLDAGTKGGSSEIGFYALAFVAGLNVDKFLSKIEDIAQAVWGFEKTRSAKGAEKPPVPSAPPASNP